MTIQNNRVGITNVNFCRIVTSTTTDTQNRSRACKAKKKEEESRSQHIPKTWCSDWSDFEFDFDSESDWSDFEFDFDSESDWRAPFRSRGAAVRCRHILSCLGLGLRVKG